MYLCYKIIVRDGKSTSPSLLANLNWDPYNENDAITCSIDIIFERTDSSPNRYEGIRPGASTSAALQHFVVECRISFEEYTPRYIGASK